MGKAATLPLYGLLERPMTARVGGGGVPGINRKNITVFRTLKIFLMILEWQTHSLFICPSLKNIPYRNYSKVNKNLEEEDGSMQVRCHNGAAQVGGWQWRLHTC